MIPIQQLTNGIKNNSTCMKCSSSDTTLATKELFEDIVNEFFPHDNKQNKKLHYQFRKYNRKISKLSPGLHLTKRTIGIATEIQCQCSVCGSQPIFETNASRTTLGHSPSYVTNESYELNCMFLLALQLLGGGGADVEVLLGFLNVPHGSTLHSTTFHCLEQKAKSHHL